jgi:hypothetical protein
MAALSRTPEQLRGNCGLARRKFCPRCCFIGSLLYGPNPAWVRCVRRGHQPFATATADVRPGKSAYVVLNAVPLRATAILADAQAAVAVHGLPLAPVTMQQRAAYAHSLTAGQTASEYEPEGKAAEEMDALFGWLACRLASNAAPKGRAMTKRPPSLTESLKKVERAPAHPAASPSRGKAKKPYYAATRAGMKKVTVTLDPAMRKRLKRLAVETDTTVEGLVRQAIAALLAKRQGSPD